MHSLAVPTQCITACLVLYALHVGRELEGTCNIDTLAYFVDSIDIVLHR